MSELTIALIGRKRPRRSAKWSKLLESITERLVGAYGTPTLGNYRDPIKEIFYILLSARTSEVLYQRAHRRLFERYPRVELIAAADVGEVWECIRVAGLGKKRTAQIVATAQQLLADLGEHPRRRLRHMTAPDVFHYLVHLPGVGPKSAFCVMMCSLDYDVFPVDVNVQRILERLGAIPKGLKHYQAQQRAPAHVPEGRSKELHVGLVEHGRKVCLPARPKCEICLLLDVCRHGRAALKKRRVETTT